jgi:tRNA(Arg) A34 adenosine deaminase TadA
MASGENKNSFYEKITTRPDDWMKMACAAAADSVRTGGGPFGAVLIHIDDETGKVIRHWMDCNHVAEYSDPTAHAEISVIRQACKELGVFRLNNISDETSNLMQPTNLSHCELYSSCEPCPMCYGAIRWAQIPVLTFALTRFDAHAQGFRDMEIYEELAQPLESRQMKIHKADFPEALEAFNLWQASENQRY